MDEDKSPGKGRETFEEWKFHNKANRKQTGFRYFNEEWNEDKK